MIPFKKLPIGEDEKKAVCEVIDSGYLSRGKRVFEFQEMFADYVGSKYAVGTQSCTMALMFALEAKGALNEHIIKIPSMTVPLVAHAIIKMGGIIEWVDEVDWVGNCYEMKPWKIIDSAHQVNRNQMKTDGGEIQCFSFYPTKPITSCEGGAIATDNIDYAEYIESIANYGRVGHETLKNSWEYSIDRIGWKGNMTDIQAAICICQLKKLDELNRARLDIRNYYNYKLHLSNKSLYLYRVMVNNRDGFVKHMKEQGIECGVHFYPLHRMPVFSKYVSGNKPLPLTEYAADHTVSLPLHTFLEKKDLDYIVDRLEDWNAANKFCNTDIQDGVVSQAMSG